MSIIITTAFDQRWCEFTQTQLNTMGINLPLERGDYGLSVENFVGKMANAYKVSVERSRIFRQITPGKAWDISASNLIVENSENNDWGWADPRNLFFLDFWKEFDSECKFILVYGSPDQSIACQMENRKSFSRSTSSWLTKWHDYHAELLRFYKENRDRSLLIHISRLSGSTSGVTKALQEAFDVPVRLLNSQSYLSPDNITLLAAKHILDDGELDASQSRALYKQLQKEASLPDSQDNDFSQLALNGFRDYKNLQVANEKLSSEIEVENQVSSDLREEVSEIKNDLRDAQQESDKLINLLEEKTNSLESSQREKVRLTNLIEQKERSLSDLRRSFDSKLANETSNKTNEIVKLRQQLEQQTAQVSENELLVEQLKQVQQELEYYFVKYQEQSKSNFDTNTVRKADAVLENSTTRKDHVYLDFRSYVDGTGWHNPENFGRWAGNLKESTISFPPLEPGNYKISVKIVDGMSTDLVKKLRLELDGKKVKLSRKFLSDAAGMLTPARRLLAQFNQIKKPFPVEMTGNFNVSNNCSLDKNHTLAFISVSTISPADLGFADTRDLTLCYQSLEISKV